MEGLDLTVAALWNLARWGWWAAQRWWGCPWLPPPVELRYERP